MKPLATERQIPDSPRVFSVEHGGDTYHFKRPNHGTLARFGEWAGHATNGNLSGNLDVLSVAVALFWFHRGKRIEATAPTASDHASDRATEAWDQYLEAVHEEFADEGIGPADLLALGGPCMDSYRGWMDAFAEAASVAGFSEPTPDNPSA